MARISCRRSASSAVFELGAAGGDFPQQWALGREFIRQRGMGLGQSDQVPRAARGKKLLAGAVQQTRELADDRVVHFAIGFYGDERGGIHHWPLRIGL